MKNTQHAIMIHLGGKSWPIAAVLLVLSAIYAAPASAQHPVLHLVNVQKPHKRVTLTSDKYYDFVLRADTLPNGSWSNTWLNAEILTATEDSIEIILWTKRTALRGQQWKLRQSTYYFDDSDSTTLATIAIADLQSIRIDPTSDDVLGGMGGGAFAVALIGAPLLALDYKGTDFRQRRYLAVAGTSIATTIVLWIAAGIVKNKVYMLESDPYYKNTWRIE